MSNYTRLAILHGKSSRSSSSTLDSSVFFFFMYLTFCLLLVINSSLVVVGFNFDIENPIVIQNSYDHAESHFGSALTLISSSSSAGEQDDDGDDVDGRAKAPRGWIIIGSPKANSTHTNYTSIKEPGLLWRCSLGPSISCQPILLDPAGEIHAKKAAVGNINLVHLDRKEGSMLGAAIASKGPNFISCASRWMNQKYAGHHLMNGLCYWIDPEQLTKPPAQEDDEDAAAAAAAGGGRNGTSGLIDWCEPEAYKRLLPLVDKSHLAYTIPGTEPVEKRFDWAFGQTGFSTHLTSNNELLLGAPGVFEWTGSIIRYRNKTSGNFPRILFPPPPPSSRQQGQQQPQPFNSVTVVKAQTTRKMLKYFNYFGYAVTSGRFFRSNSERSTFKHQQQQQQPRPAANLELDDGIEIQYASGAPRAALLSGQVLVFTINEQSESLELLVEPIDGGYNGFGSYFGSVLAAGDMNGDGFDELLIGAPLYSSMQSSSVVSSSSSSSSGGTVAKTMAAVPGQNTSANANSSSASGGEAGDDDSSGGALGGAAGDEGCVFVYFSNGDHFTENTQEICGGHSPGARFGSAITILGDINDDNIQDIAIGAPYENDGQGVVYIYQGSRTILTLVQKISPHSISKNIKGFGLSLSNAVDIDGNQFPDLAVGAYETNHVLVYRSIPVVNITGNLSVSVGKLGTLTGLFQITSCLSFNGRVAPPTMKIWLKITVDIEVRKQRIVEFLTSSSGSPEGNPLPPGGAESSSGDGAGTFKSYLIRLNEYSRDGGGSCYTYTATTVGDLDFVTLPVTVRQEFWPQSNRRLSSTSASGANEGGGGGGSGGGGGAEGVKLIPADVKPIYVDILKKKATPISKKNSDPNLVENLLVRHRPGNPAFVDFEKKLPQSMFGDSVSSTYYTVPIAAICEDDGDPDCLAKLQLTATLENPDGDRYSYPDEPYIIGSYKSLILRITLENVRETANLPLSIDIGWSGPPYFKNSRGYDCRAKMSSGLGTGSVISTSTGLDSSNNIVVLVGGGGGGGSGLAGRGEKSEQLYSCFLKKPLTRNKKEFVELELDTSEMYSDGELGTVLEFQLYANTSSALVQPAEATVAFPVTGKSELLFYGQGSEAPYFDNMTAETVNFTHVFEVGLQGPSPVYSVMLDFHIPSAVIVDKVEHELLRIREPITTYDGNRLRCTSVNAPFYVETAKTRSNMAFTPEEDDEIYLFSSSSSAAQTQVTARSKRQATTTTRKSSPRKEPSLLSHITSSLGRTQLVLGCASIVSGPASASAPTPATKSRNLEISSCLHVQCEAHFFHPGSRALIEFRLRLVTKTAKNLFLDDEREVVVVQSIGRVSLMNSTGHRFGQMLTSFPKGLIKVQRPSELEAWILIVAMGTGLILLTLLTVTLTRCGFFRRRKREELDALKAQHEVNEHFGLNFQSAFDEDDYDYGPGGGGGGVRKPGLFYPGLMAGGPAAAAAAAPHFSPGTANGSGAPPGPYHHDFDDYDEIYDYRVYDDRTYC